MEKLDGDEEKGNKTSVSCLVRLKEREECKKSKNRGQGSTWFRLSWRITQGEDEEEEEEQEEEEAEKKEEKNTEDICVLPVSSREAASRIRKNVVLAVTCHVTWSPLHRLRATGATAATTA